MHEFAFEVYGWWHTSGRVCVLSEDVLTTRLQNMIKKAFLKTKLG